MCCVRHVRYHLFSGGSSVCIPDGIFVQLWDAADFFWHCFCNGSGSLSCRAGEKCVDGYSSGDLGNTPKNNTTMRSKM